MKVFAIGDLHLAHDVAKPMHIFGEVWQDHMTQIEKKWRQVVGEEDLVIVCGDISWGMRLPEAKRDLDFLEALPGQKVCIKGNHDYWWEKIGKLNTLYEKTTFLQNTAWRQGDLAVCGTRGWLCPNEVGLTPEDQKIYEREAARLKLSLDDALKKGAKHMIVALHYPPTNEVQAPSLFTELLTQYPVVQVVYGHLHDQKAWGMCVQGERAGVHYSLVAADYLDFMPRYIGDFR